jgi:hypothetical protein
MGYTKIRPVSLELAGSSVWVMSRKYRALISLEDLYDVILVKIPLGMPYGTGIEEFNLLAVIKVLDSRLRGNDKYSILLVMWAAHVLVCPGVSNERADRDVCRAHNRTTDLE